MDCSLPGSSVHGIFQASILKWVAISSSRGSSRPSDWTRIPCISRWILYCGATREVMSCYSCKYESFHFILSFLRSSVSNMYNIYSVFYSIRQYWSTWWHTDDSLCKQLTYTYSPHKHSIVGVFSHLFDFLYNIFFCLACSIIRI